jgi:hypothetical protein
MALSHVMNIIGNAGIVGAGTGSGGGGGGGSNLDSQTVTVGTHTITVPAGNGLPSTTTVYNGSFDWSGTAYGSVSDGTSNIYSGAAVDRLMYYYNTVYAFSGFNLFIDGTNRANSGWTTLTVGTTAYQRQNAVYTASSGGNTTWTWSTGGDTTGANNPFAATGQTTTCVFT